jgi:hypothetical protein
MIFVDETKCILCSHKLHKRKDGLVCKNRRCKLYWKYGGWTYINRCHFCKKILFTKEELKMNRCNKCKEGEND